MRSPLRLRGATSGRHDHVSNRRLKTAAHEGLPGIPWRLLAANGELSLSGSVRFHQPGSVVRCGVVSFMTTANGERRVVRRTGCDLAYEVVGSGPPVLLLHPLYTNRGLWRLYHFVEMLADRFTLVMIDSLGHGESSKVRRPERYSQQERAADAAAALDDLGLENAHVVGYSMGAWTAGAVAAHFGARVASLTLGGWDPYRGANAPKDFARPETIESSFVASLEWFRSSPYTAGFVANADEAALRICHRVLFEPQVAVTDMAAHGPPTLVVCGRDDVFFSGARQCAQEIPGAHFLAVEGADHRTTIGLRGVREALLEFLASI
jgi:pimeloyl-ACP methyl ester carboxylesterase